MWLYSLLLLNLIISHTVLSFKCPTTSSSKEANPMSCRKFYFCQNGNPDSQGCGDTDTFDVLYRQCRATELVKSCDYSPTDCYIDSGSGFDYQGNISVTATGEPCVEWSKSVYSFSKYKLIKNYCRNPNPDQFTKPWCTTNNITNPMQECAVPKCTGSSVKFAGKGEMTVSTGTGGANSTYDLEASYQEQILLYIRPSQENTQTRADLFTISSLLDDQSYYVTLYKNVITVYAWLEAGESPAKANTMINLVDGKAHKIHIRRTGSRVFLNVDDGPDHYSQLSGLTDKLMLPMKVNIGKNFKGCISSFDIVTQNAKGKNRHYEPFEKLLGKSTDNQMEVKLSSDFNGYSNSGCMLTPRFSETMIQESDSGTDVIPPEPPTNGTVAEVGKKDNKELFIILAGVIGAALIILIIVLIIVCRSRNKDKGVYKLKETKQFDWEYGNLPPSSKNKLVGESEHGV